MGARLAVDLADEGHHVTGTWYHSEDRLLADLPEGLRYERADLSDAEVVDALFARAGGFDAVVHAAARVAAREEDSAYLRDTTRANVLSQSNLVGAALRTGCERFVFMSTISVYGNRGAPAGGYLEADAAPTSYYGWSKRAAEQLLDVAAVDHGLSAVTLRLAGVHGIGRENGALATMAHSALAGKAISVNEPNSRFRWVFIEDVSQAIGNAVHFDLPAGHHIANLASADIFTLRELAEHLKHFAASDCKIESRPGAGGRNEVMNIDVAKCILDFVPTPLTEFLPRYLEAVRREGAARHV